MNRRTWFGSVLVLVPLLSGTAAEARAGSLREIKLSAQEQAHFVSEAKFDAGADVEVRAFRYIGLPLDFMVASTSEGFGSGSSNSGLARACPVSLKAQELIVVFQPPRSDTKPGRIFIRNQEKEVERLFPFVKRTTTTAVSTTEKTPSSWHAWDDSFNVTRQVNSRPKMDKVGEKVTLVEWKATEKTGKTPARSMTVTVSATLSPEQPESP